MDRKTAGRVKVCGTLLRAYIYRAMDARQDQIDLHEFVQTGSRQALGRLAGRYLDFVYGLARREMRDAHLAEDVTQAVFLVLAQKAHRIKPAALPNWLFITTRRVSSNARKMAGRRRFHEQRAATLSGETAMTDDPHETADAQFQINEALAAQSESDRGIVLMRYMQQMDVNQISQTLGLNARTARRRLERAIERLRKWMTRRGRVLSTAAVGTMIAGISEPAPASLAAAVMGGTASAGGAALATTAVGNLLSLKLAAIILLSLGIVGAVAQGVWQSMTQQVVVVPAPRPGAVTIPNTPVDYTGLVTDAEGKPVVGVRVWSELNTANPSQARAVEAETVTDAQGRYSLSLPPLESIGLSGRYNWSERNFYFDHPSFAIGWVNVRPARQYRTPDDAEMALSVRLEASVELRVRVMGDGKPVANATVGLDLQDKYSASNGSTYARYRKIPSPSFASVTTDAQGLATIKRIAASTRAHVSVTVANFARFNSRDVIRGDTNPVRAGGGEYVINLYPGGQIRLAAAPGAPALPSGSEVQAYPISGVGLSPRIHGATLEADGSYLLTGLEAGTYELRINPYVGKPDGVWTVAGVVSVNPGQTTQALVEHSPGRVVSGRVVDSTGQPVNGHWVVLKSMFGDRQVRFDRVETSSDGRFEFLAASGKYILNTEDYKTAARNMDLNIHADDPKTISIGDLAVSPFPLVKGQLLDASNKPVAGFLYLNADVFPTAADGSFSLRVRSEVARHAFVVSQDGLFGATIPIEQFVPPPGEANKPDGVQSIKLRALGVLSGRVLSELAEPVTSAGVFMLLGEPGDNSELAGIKLQRDGAKFMFTGIPAGIAPHLSINAGGIDGISLRLDPEPLTPGEVRDLGDLVLRPSNPLPAGVAPPPTQTDESGWVRGKVIDPQGTPILAAAVQTIPQSGTFQDRLTDTSDQDGVFLFKGLPANQPVSLQVEASGFSSRKLTTNPGQEFVIKMTPVSAELINKPAPELNVGQWVSGNPTTLAELRGRVVLLHIGVETVGGAYSDTYRPIFAAAAKYAKQPFSAIVVHRFTGTGRGRRGPAADIPSPRVVALPMAMDLPSPSRVDELAYFGVTARLYGVEASPRSGPAMILIDKNGLVRAVPTLANLDQWIEKLLAE